MSRYQKYNSVRDLYSCKCMIYIGASLVSVGMFSASSLISAATWQIVFPFTTVRTCVDIVDVIDYVM